MIGDLVTDAKIVYSKNGATFPLGATGIKLGVNGRYAVSGRITVPLTDTLLPFGQIVTPGFVGIANLQPSLIQTPVGLTMVRGGAAGAVTFTYKVSAVQADGAYTSLSAGVTLNNCFSPLDNSHWLYITWQPVPDAVSYNVWRTAGGGAQGAGIVQNVLASTVPLACFDNGLQGNGATPPVNSPFDCQCLVGPTNASYPILVKGNEVMIFRWALSTAIHTKALLNPTDIEYLIIDD